MKTRNKVIAKCKQDAIKYEMTEQETKEYIKHTLQIEFDEVYK